MPYGPMLIWVQARPGMYQFDLHDCVQRDANTGWSSLYPSFWSSLFAKPSPILEIAVDTDRNILYTRSENSSIQVAPSRACYSRTSAELANKNAMHIAATTQQKKTY